DAEARRPFDLSAGPLFRAVVLRLGQQEHVLLATMHHIVSDGWATGGLIDELTALYEAYRNEQPAPLAELEIWYADYAIWQRSWLQGDVLEEQIGYWCKQLEGIEPLELPTDYVRPVGLSGRGASVEVRLSPATAQGLAELGRREGVTLFMAVL